MNTYNMHDHIAALAGVVHENKTEILVDKAVCVERMNSVGLNQDSLSYAAKL